MPRPRFRAGSMAQAWFTLAVAILLARARAGAFDPVETAPARGSWQVGKAIAIPVHSGRSSFDLPASRNGAQTLVIVSALSRDRGPYRIQLSARPIEMAEPIAPMPGSVDQPPRKDAPVPGPIPPASSEIPRSERTFHLMVAEGDVASARNYRAISARLRAVGRRVQVYVDRDDGPEVEASTLREIVSTFDNEVFPTAASRFGTAFDVDDDGRFTVLLSGWLTRLSGGKVRVDGFVRGADLDSSLGAPFSNHCDMMYLSTSLRAGPHLRTVIAHEYAHAVTFSRKPLANPSRGMVGPEEEGWLDEAIAHLVEDAHGFSRSNIDYRVSAFLSQPERYQLVVEDYYAADLFRSHGNRGATYLFLRWCVDTYGTSLLDQLVRSNRRGVANLEAATGAGFPELFRRWTVALYMSGLDPTSTLEGGYRSVDPRAELEDWILAGPRAAVITPGGPGDSSWLAGGTTAHYALLGGSQTGPLRVEIRGPAEAEIQVTAVPLPAGLGRPELIVRPSTSPDGEIRIEAQVAEHEGTPVRLGALAWERLVPDSDPYSPRFRRDGLDMLGIASMFGTSALPGGGLLRSRPIRLLGVRSGDGPLVFKAVGTDPQGRRVAAWTVVDPSRNGPLLDDRGAVGLKTSSPTTNVDQ
ncbi:hypothetical protein P12x_001891 [Tundrisphaera lichenicola]|uniref:hypothetical protein n=1 Tax=Tundrisphaera lichenicola TaxID=2029860 RepID=UPI003EBD8B34